MKKCVLVSLLLVSLNAFATQLPHDFVTAHRHDHVKALKTSWVYTGKDISRSRVAIANETQWGADKILLG